MTHWHALQSVSQITPRNNTRVTRCTAVRWAAAQLLTLGAEDGSSWPLRPTKGAVEGLREAVWMMERIMVWIAGEYLRV